MRSLAGVSVRALVRSRRRYVLTSVGASLGVAVLFAVLVVSGASRDALDAAIAGQTGRADVVVSPTGSFDATLPAGAAAQVRALPDVVTVVEVAGTRSSLRPVEDTGPLEDPRSNIVSLTGWGEGHEELHDLARRSGSAPAAGQPEIEVPLALAERFELEVGDAVRVAAPDGPVEMRVVGILEDRGAATGNQGSVAFTSMATVRTLLGNPEAVTGLQVRLAPGVTPTSWIAANRDQLTGLSVQDAGDLAAGFKSFVDGVNAAMTLVAAIALFVGGFLVYLTFSVAVAERTRMLGTLRALGTVARRVRRMVVLEAALLGTICAGIGLVIGYGLAALAIDMFGGLLDLDLGGLGTPVGPAVVSAALGVLVAVAASWSPARRAARIDPVSAMRGGSLAIERPARRWLGPVLGVVGLVVGLVGGSPTMTGLGLLFLFTGAVLAVHLAIGPLGRVAGGVMRRVSPGTGAIAVRHLERERSRSSYTLALVMVSMSAILAIGATNLAMSDSLDTVLDGQASAIQVGAPGALAAGVQEELAAVEGTGVVSPLRFGETSLRVSTTDAAGNLTSQRAIDESFLQIIEPTTFFEVASLPYTNGDDASVRDALAAGGSIVLSAPDANALGVGLGDEVQVDTVDGPRPFTVAGTYAVFGGGFGTIASAADLEPLGGGRVHGFLVGTDGGDIEALAERIRGQVGERHHLIVDSPADTRAFANGQLAGFFSLAYAILALTAVISLLGLANTLVVAVLSRTREIGVLRSYGARRRQIRRMVTVEAMTMSAIATVLAAPLAAVVGFAVVNAQRDALGAELSFRYPWPLLVPLALGGLAVAALAAAAPSRRASRLAIVDTLRSE